MKKEKAASMPTSVEGQIRSRARNLPVYKCYISNEWEQSQMANVLVIRRHNNGNLTVGCYLVDLLLLGVKKCYYRFNEPEYHALDILDVEKMTECSYELAHNVVYSGLAFAEDLGFMPHKDFKTAQYILDEDTDDIPLIEIPVGKDGKPVVYINSRNDGRNEIARLEKSVGKGNFEVIYIGDTDDELEGYGDEEDVQYEDDLLTYDPVVYHETITKLDTNFDEFYEKSTGKLNLSQIYALVDFTYNHQAYDEDERFELNEETRSFFEDPRIDPDLIYSPEIQPFMKQFDEIWTHFDINDHSQDPTILAKMKALLEQHPEPGLAYSFFSFLYEVDEEENTRAFVESWRQRHGDHYLIRLMYMKWLALEQRFDDIIGILEDNASMNALTKEQVTFPVPVFADFCACCTLAYLSQSNIRKAEPFYTILTSVENTAILIFQARSSMVKAKKNILEHRNQK